MYSSLVLTGRCSLDIVYLKPKKLRFWRKKIFFDKIPTFDDFDQILIVRDFNKEKEFFKEIHRK